MIVLDSSLIIAALRHEEEKHHSCRKILELVKNGALAAAEPYSVLVEISAAIKRRTDFVELAERIKADLKNIGGLHFFELTERRAEEACALAIKTGVRGMDALVMQIAAEMDASLVTLDRELEEKARGIVSIKSVDDF